MRVIRPVRRKIRPRADDHQQPHMLGSFHHKRKQFQRRRINPLDILVDHKHRPLLLHAPELRKERSEGFLLPLLRVHLKRSALPNSRHREEIGQKP